MERAASIGETALEIWREVLVAYPLQWTARFPLLGVALRRDDVDRAIDSARALLGPVQQLLPEPIAGGLERGVAAWDAGRPEEARDALAAIVSPSAFGACASSGTKRGNRLSD